MTTNGGTAQKILLSHGPSIRRWKRKSVRQRRSEPSVVCHARQALSGATGMLRYLRKREDTPCEGRIGGKPGDLGLRQQQQLPATGIGDRGARVERHVGPTVRASCQRAYPFFSPLHDTLTGEPVGPAPRNRKTVSRLGGQPVARRAPRASAPSGGPRRRAPRVSGRINRGNSPEYHRAPPRANSCEFYGDWRARVVGKPPYIFLGEGVSPVLPSRRCINLRPALTFALSRQSRRVSDR